MHSSRERRAQPVMDLVSPPSKKIDASGKRASSEKRVLFGGDLRICRWRLWCNRIDCRAASLLVVSAFPPSAPGRLLVVGRTEAVVQESRADNRGPDGESGGD
ncbi:hypothetical protein MTO96_048543 [Rhipicephalus appendiculatus]